jgi:hypothetical protein
VVISANSTAQLIFVMETSCVFFEVRAVLYRRASATASELKHFYSLTLSNTGKRCYNLLRSNRKADEI